MKNVKKELKFLELVREGYYTVRKNGDIFRTKCHFCKGKCSMKLHGHHDKRGYCTIMFTYQGKQTAVFAHRVVYSYFRGEIPDGMLINHIDGNPGNNALRNLEAVTPKQNIHHATYVTRTMKNFGESHPFARLKPMDVYKIIYFSHSGAYTKRALADRFGISVGYVSRICKMKAWRSLFDKEYILSCANEKLKRKKSSSPI